MKHSTGKFWNWKNSPFRDPDTDKFRWSPVWAVILDTIIKVSAGYFVIVSFKYAMYAGINQGVITTIFTLSAIYVALISWFMFNEKLNRFHIIGMLLLIGCTILIVFSKSPDASKTLKVYDQEVQQESPLPAVLFALLTTVLYSFRTIYVKLFVQKLKFNTFDYMTYSYLLSGVFFLPFMINDMYFYGFIPDVVFLGIASGVLNGFGAFFLFYATSTGMAGPAYSLKNIEPVVQCIVGVFFLDQHLNVNQFIAICMGILGSLVLTLGPYLFSSKEEKQKENELLLKDKESKEP